MKRGSPGFGLLEIVFAVSIVAGALYALASVFLLAGRASELSREKLQASFLLEEGLEVLRFSRDSSWSQNIAALSVGTDYYLNFSTSTVKWTTTPSPMPAVDGIYARSFQIQNVLRDSGDNIDSSGTTDPGTKKVTMKVIWSFGGQNQTSTLETYLMNIFNN
ncbi:MAG: hypothetical protein Q8R12_02255 [bacterium]|nr:hypothetical protein [bacterium]